MCIRDRPRTPRPFKPVWDGVCDHRVLRADVSSPSPHISRLHRARIEHATIALRLRCGGRSPLLAAS
eukprot:4485798-Alexandrium_andersonii.AAC.1